MSNMNLQQARVVDPVLSSHASGYTNAEFIGSLLFPAVATIKAGGSRIEFGKEAFQKYNLRRAAGGKLTQVTFGHEGKPFACTQDGLEVPLPDEVRREADGVPGIDLQQNSIDYGMEIIKKSLEDEQAAIARNWDNYDNNHRMILAAGSQWSDANGKPTANILLAKEEVRKTTGRYPNLVVLSPVAMAAAQEHATIVDRIKFTGRDSATPEILAKLWGVEKVVVGPAVTANDAGEFSDVWGNDVIVAFSRMQGSPGMHAPNYGYTYTLAGHPAALKPYYDNPSLSWKFPVLYERAPVLTAAGAGFLIKDAAVL